MRHRGWCTGTAVLVVGLMAAPAWSQQEPRSLQRVLVQHDASDDEVEGRLFELGPQTAVLLVDGQTLELPLPSIARIRTARDRWWDGGLWGAAIGGAIGAMWCAGGGDCRKLVLSQTAGYGLIGLALDGLEQNRHTIYSRPAAPPVALKGTTVSLRIRF